MAAPCFIAVIVIVLLDYRIPSCFDSTCKSSVRGQVYFCSRKLSVSKWQTSLYSAFHLCYASCHCKMYLIEGLLGSEASDSLPREALLAKSQLTLRKARFFGLRLLGCVSFMYLFVPLFLELYFSCIWLFCLNAWLKFLLLAALIFWG